MELPYNVTINVLVVLVYTSLFLFVDFILHVILMLIRIYFMKILYSGPSVCVITLLNQINRTTITPIEKK